MATITEQFELSSASSFSSNTNTNDHGGELPSAEASTSRLSERPMPTLQPVDHGRGAWQFCIAATALETMVWGLTTCYGVFQSYYLSHPPFSRYSPVQISTIGSLQLGLMMAEGLFIFGALKSYRDKIKTMMWASGVVCCVALVAASFAQELWTLQLCQGVLFGVFGGSLYYPAVLWLPEWFDQRRGLAAGIIFGGCGAGGAFFPLVMTKLLQTVGFRWTLRVLAALFAVVCAPAVYYCKPRLPVVIAKPRQVKLLPPVGFFSMPLFWLNAVAILLQLIGFYAVSFYIPTYAQAIGLSELQGTYALMGFNAASTIGKIVAGFAVDRVPYLALLLLFGVMGTVSSLAAWGYSSQVAVFVVFLIVFGSVACSSTPIWPAAATSISGPQGKHDVSVIFFCFTEMMAIASIVGPIVASGLLDRPVSGIGGEWGKFGYAAPTIYVGVSMGLSSIVAASAGLAKQKTS